MTNAPSARTASMLVAALCLVWGSTWVVIAAGLDAMPPFTSAAIRFAIAAVAMVFVVRWLAGREGGAAPPLTLVLSSGVLNFFGSYGAVYWSEQHLPSSLCSILFAVFTLLVAGRSVSEIASELNVAGSTVSNHVTKIREKLGARTVGEIIRYAHQAGFLS